MAWIANESTIEKGRRNPDERILCVSRDREYPAVILSIRPNARWSVTEFIALWTVHQVNRRGQSYRVMALPWYTVVSQRLACPPLKAAGPPWAGRTPALPYPLAGNPILAYRCKRRRRGLAVEQMPHLCDEIKACFKTELRHSDTWAAPA